MRKKLILWDSVRREGISHSVDMGLEFPIEGNAFKKLKSELSKTFKILKKDKRFSQGAYSVDFHINANGEEYIHRTSLYFVPEGVKPLLNDLEKLLSDIETRIEEVEAKYKGRTYDIEDGDTELHFFVMYFKREMSAKQEKGRERRIKRHKEKLIRSKPMRFYWKTIRQLRSTGLTLKKARRFYRKTTKQDRTKIRKTYQLGKLRRIIGGIKRRKRK